ncbi:hypothetical protein [Helicobacter felis]|uniref:hypothetical protein n=1 Tax=Helicobacter felis TaxID=214 RepID=UPI000CF16940|nr:hypothetical protein [Helicobacter felis]
MHGQLSGEFKSFIVTKFSAGSLERIDLKLRCNVKKGLKNFAHTQSVTDTKSGTKLVLKHFMLTQGT